MKIALVGKGGVGKSMIAGTLARLLARQGHPVLAVDLDSNPGLQFSLGLGGDFVAGLPAEAVEEREGSAYGWGLARGLTPAQAVHRFAVPAPDGVRFLSDNKVHEDDIGAPRRSIAAVLSIVRGFDEPGWHVIGDLEAGTTMPFERHHDFADQVLIVVNPSASSALAARRIGPLLEDLPRRTVANRWRNGAGDHPGLPAMAYLPFDPEVAEVERAGLAPLDHCPGSPAVRAVEELLRKLMAEEAAR